MRFRLSCVPALCAFLIAGWAGRPPHACAESAAPPTGLQSAVVFGDYTPLAGNTELARRMLSPLTAARIPELLAKARKTLSERPVNLAAERFTLYVPAQAPPQGYGVLVFVPPWDDGRLPSGWASVLDRRGVIFVSAQRSGNDANPLARREPLALLALENVRKRYPVDATSVYVGGFSGGSRIAMRLALGYADVFKGALLDAGSDPIGDAVIPLPPRDVFHRFQEASRLVYVTGAQDMTNLDKDAESVGSMRRWCVFDLDTQSVAGKGHEVIDPVALDVALGALAKPRAPDPERLTACRARIEAAVDSELDRIQALVAGGSHDSATKALQAVDSHYGGLAAPRSVELERANAAPAP